MRRLLLAVHTEGHFVELSRVAALVTRLGGFEPIFYFAQPYTQQQRDVRRCRETGARCVEPVRRPSESAAAPGGGVWRRVRTAAKNALWRLPFPVTLVRALVRQWLNLIEARRVVETTDPHLIVLCEDVVGCETAALIEAGHERGVRSVIVPFTVATALEPAEAYYRDPRFVVKTPSSRLAAWLYPRWVYRHRDRRLLAAPAPQLIARELWGLAPPLPWVLHSGAADAIAVESTAMERHYRREGLPARQLVPTGALSDDVLAESRANAAASRARLCERHGWDPARPLVLCALPPDQYVQSGPQTDFDDYAGLVDFWIATLASHQGWNVLVRLHPRTSADELRPLERLNVRLATTDTAALVPLCDLYVASVSATIRWAIACGKPVLNYDAYRLRWTDYDGVDGVLRVETRAQFEAAVGRLATDQVYVDELRARQQAAAGQWGRLDGASGDRLLALFNRLAMPGDQNGSLADGGAA